MVKNFNIVINVIQDVYNDITIEISKPPYTPSRREKVFIVSACLRKRQVCKTDVTIGTETWIISHFYSGPSRTSRDEKEEPRGTTALAKLGPRAPLLLSANHSLIYEPIKARRR